MVRFRIRVHYGPKTFNTARGVHFNGLINRWNNETGIIIGQATQYTPITAKFEL